MTNRPPSTIRTATPSRVAGAIAAIAAIALTLANPAAAIDWCHDYTQSALTGSDSKGVKPGELRGALNQGGYERYNVGNMPPSEVDQSLQPGDVIIFGNAHSGVVGKDGKITHYVQQRDDKNQIVGIKPGDIRGQPTFRTSTFDEIKNFTRDNNGRIQQPYNTSRIQLWRPPGNLNEEARNRMRDAIRKRIRNAAQQAAQNAARSATRTGITRKVPHTHHAHRRR